MSVFTLKFPSIQNEENEIEISSGELVFLVGANGVGKSTLMQRFAVQHRGKVRRITAHRQVWFNSNTIDLTPASREQSEKNIISQDVQPQARWRDDYASARSQVTIFDLIESENVEARKIAYAARAGNMKEVENLAKSQSPMSKLNDILRIANLDIRIKVDQGSKLLAERDTSPAYSIAELSDGERNALLIIANVLTAPENNLILLDEPERHLHRSIVSPLLSTLLSCRNDCAFIISTHDISLPLDQDQASVLLARKYTHSPESWEVDFVPDLDKLDVQAAEAVLGSRRKILFIEGTKSSLDLQIYQILYPEISIKPVGSCVEVEKMVKGLNSSSDIHWISAYGLIDKDNREQYECDALAKIGIIAIEQYSVESIYYHPIVIKGVLDRATEFYGLDAEEVNIAITESIISTVKQQERRLAARMVERQYRENFLKFSPSWKTILEESVEISFCTQDLLDKELKNISNLINDKDIEKIVSRYPIRETQALQLIAKALRFNSSSDYEQAVRKMLIDSKDEREKVLNLLQPVTNQITLR